MPPSYCRFDAATLLRFASVTACLISLPSVLQGQDVRPVTRNLVLEELSARRVPHGFVVTGAAARGDLLVAVDSGRRAMLWWGGAGRALVDGVVPGILGIAFVDDTTIEVLHRYGIARLGVSGHRVSADSFDVPQGVRSAGSVNGRWVVGVRDSNGGFRIETLARNGVRRVVRLLSSYSPVWIERKQAFTPAATISVDATDAYATLLEAPYTTYRINVDEAAVEDSFYLPNAQIQDSGGGASTEARLVAIGLIPFSEGFLLVLADPRRDARVIYLYDSSGGLVRKRVVSGALGLISADLERQTFLAERSTDVTELVLYRWHWSSP